MNDQGSGPAGLLLKLLAVALLLLVSLYAVGIRNNLQHAMQAGPGGQQRVTMLQADQASVQSRRNEEILDSYGMADWHVIQSFGYKRESLLAEMEFMGWKRVKEELDACLLEAAFRPAGAETKIGKATAWRELDNWPRLAQGQRSRFIVANFSGDSADEVLLLSPRLQLLNLKGEGIRLGLRDSSRIVGSWDCDGDGLEELILTAGDAAGNAGDGALLSATGIGAAEKLRLEGGLLGGRLITADFLGTGAEAVLLLRKLTPEHEELPVLLGPQGQVAAALGSSWSWPYSTVGDIDGDDRAELVSNCANDALLAGGIDQEDEVYELPDSIRFFDHTGCVDITGDGKAEVISREGLVVDLAANRLISLVQPAGWQNFRFEGIERQHFCTISSGGEAYFAAAPMREGSAADSLCIWDSAGKLIHLELLGEKVHCLDSVVDSQGRQQLVIATDTRLLTAPYKGAE